MRKFCLLIISLMAMTILFHNTNVSAYDKIETKQNQKLPSARKGLMPSVGEVKALVFLVQFSDQPGIDEQETDILRDELFDIKTTGSLSWYYNVSSYGQLTIDGDVFAYMAHCGSEHYNNGAEGREELVGEILDSFDSQIDYSDYDSDKDGIIDALYIDYVNENTGEESFWKSGQFEWEYNKEKNLDGAKVNRYVWVRHDSDTVPTLLHETGHLLGLDDYYENDTGESGGFGGFEMMYCDFGDFSAVSKMLLGWLKPKEISQNEHIELRNSQSYPDAAVIYPNGNTDSTEYFVLEYIALQGVNINWRANDLMCTAVGSHGGGMRIWRVNTALNEDGTDYKYKNNYKSKPFLESMGIADGYEVIGDKVIYYRENETKTSLYYEGDEFTPYTNPSSCIYGDSESFYGPFESSGISVTNIVTDFEAAAADVSFSDVEKKKPLKYTFRYKYDNELRALMYFDSETSILDKDKIKLIDKNGKEYAFSAEISKIPGNDYRVMSITAKDIWAGDVTLKMEAGALQNVYGIKNEEILETMKPAAADMSKDTYLTGFYYPFSESSSGATSLKQIDENTLYGFAKNEDGYIYLCKVEDEDDDVKTESIKLMKYYPSCLMYTEIVQNRIFLMIEKFTHISSNPYDGLIIYEVKLDGSYEKKMSWEDCPTAGGRLYDFCGKILISFYSPFSDNTNGTKGVFIIDLDTWEKTEWRYFGEEENDNPKQIGDGGFDIYTIDSERAAVLYKNKLYIMDKDGKILKSTDLCGDNSFIEDHEKVSSIAYDENQLILIMERKARMKYNYRAVYFDMDLNFIKRKNILDNYLFGIAQIDGFIGDKLISREKDGRYICKVWFPNRDMYQYNDYDTTVKPGHGWKNIVDCVILDKDFNYITSYAGELGYWESYYFLKNHLYRNGGGTVSRYDEAVPLQGRMEEATDIHIQDGNVKLHVGDTCQLKGVINPAGATEEIKWSSSDPSVVTVSSCGKVTAKGEGEAVIMLSAGSCSATCEIKVGQCNKHPAVIKEYWVEDLYFSDVSIEEISGISTYTCKIKNRSTTKKYTTANELRIDLYEKGVLKSTIYPTLTGKVPGELAMREIMFFQYETDENLMDVDACVITLGSPGIPTELPTMAPTKAPTMAPVHTPGETPNREPEVTMIVPSIEAPTETPTEATAEAPTEKPAEATAEAPTGKPAEVTAEAPTGKPAVATAEAPTEKPAEVTAEPPDRKPSNVSGSSSGQNQGFAAGQVSAVMLPSVTEIHFRDRTILWKRVKKAIKYEIYRSIKKAGAYHRIAVIVSNSYTDKSAKRGKTYYYKVRGINPVLRRVGAFSRKMKNKVPVFKAPTVKVKVKLYTSELNYAKIAVSRYKGKYLQVSFSKNGGNSYRVVKLKNNRLKKKRMILRIGIPKKLKTLCVRIRTYKLNGGKKVYGAWSMTKRIKNAA